MSGGSSLSSGPDGAIDPVILDLDLLGMSGWEVLDRLAASRPEVKILILAGNSEPDVAERSVSQGAMGCVTKPVSAGSLVERISSLVS